MTTPLLDGMRVLDAGHLAAGAARHADARRPRRGRVQARAARRRPDARVPRPVPRHRVAQAQRRRRPAHRRRDGARARRSPPTSTSSARAGDRASRIASGSGYDAVAAVNPSVIYCSISGYGQTGPLVDQPGHDLNYQALAGAVGASAMPATPSPSIPRVPIADLAAANVAALLVCAAWAKRLQTGEGERIDVAMADVIASWVGPHVGHGDARPRRTGAAVHPATASSVPPTVASSRSR